jgi:hypothetical protein
MENILRQKVGATRESERGLARLGQSAVLFAALLLPITLMLGLIIDLGYAYGQKRITQDVADNGSLAGAQVIGKYLVGTAGVNGTSVASAICDVAGQSSGSFKDATLCLGSGSSNGLNISLTATYVDANGNPLPGGTVVRGGAIPSGAQGIQLTPTEDSPTFFSKVAGFNKVTVSSQAEALLGVITSYNAGAANYLGFAVWSNAADCANSNGAYGCTSVGTDVTFRDNNWCATAAGGDPLCQANPSFKGLLTTNSGQITDGEWIPGDTGNKTGWWNATLTTYCNNHWIVVLPVIDQVTSNPNLMVQVVGFVGLYVDQPCGAHGSSPDTGTIAYFSAEGNTSGGGIPPSPGIPNVTSVKLVE